MAQAPQPKPKEKAKPKVKPKVKQIEVEYLEGSTLKEWLDDKQKPQQFLIIDVRDNDYGPKKIRGATNIPSYTFDPKYVKQLIEDWKDIPMLIFHCAYSQVRGPDSAEFYAKHKSNKDYFGYPSQRVMILTAGFRGFWQRFPEYCVSIE